MDRIKIELPIKKKANQLINFAFNTIFNNTYFRDDYKDIKVLIRCIYYLGARRAEARDKKALFMLLKECETNIEGSIPDINSIPIIKHCIAAIGYPGEYK